MAKTVIGLFNNLHETQQVVQALMDDGFRREDIRTITSQEGASVGTLTAHGVPAPEVQYYTEGLRQGGALVIVEAADDRADRAVAIMERYPAVDLGTRTAADAAREREHSGTREVATEDVKIPVVEEELQVGTRQVRRGGVRLYTHVTEQPVEERVRLREEHVTVERHPVDRPATNADLTAFKEGTIELTETAEEAVVSKQARVVEEVVVNKEVEERTETVRDTVRRTEVEVEPVGAEAASEARGFATYETDFRHHYTTTFASGGQGHTYERCAPAYRYGYDLASDRQYAGCDWGALEPEARRRWEAQQKGTWEEFKETIRYAWEKVRGRR